MTDQLVNFQQPLPYNNSPADRDLSLEQPYIQYFNALISFFGKEALTPEGGSSSGFVPISLFGPEGQDNIRIYRHIGKFSDGGMEIQDEIHINVENQGVQFNFEQNEEGQLVLYPQGDRLSATAQRVISIFNQGSQTPSSKLYCKNKLYFVSDGQKWVPVESSVGLPSGSSALQSK